MHDTDITRPDEAAAAIRDALPTPDDAATDRIAARIADGARDAERAARPRRTNRRRIGTLRPALAGGAVAIAAAVALLAPGDDGSSPQRGLLALGPDAAAAEVLAVAGTSALNQPWHPLGADELHYTRTVEMGTGMRYEVTTENWMSRDGSAHLRITDRPAHVPAGESLYVPASECVRRADLAAPPSLDPVGETLALGSSLPGCWSDDPYSPMLANATGEIVAAPPKGAYVELVASAGAGDHALRFGDEVLEGGVAQPVPPGVVPAANPNATADPVATAVPVEFVPFHLPVNTTWVKVSPRPVVRFDMDIPATQGVPSGSPAMLAWNTAMSVDELEKLPTDPSALIARIRAEAIEATPKASDVTGNELQLGGDTPGLDPATATMSMALELLSRAPVSPKVRAATFEALGSLTMDGQSAQVDRVAKLPDGSPAVAVTFPIVPPKGYEANGSPGDAYVLLFDPESAALRGSELRLGTSSFVTSYDAPRRVSEVDPAD